MQLTFTNNRYNVASDGDIRKRREPISSFDNPLDRSCRECGRVRRTPDGVAYLYRFTIDTDKGEHVTARFCSLSCSIAHDLRNDRNDRVQF